MEFYRLLMIFVSYSICSIYIRILPETATMSQGAEKLLDYTTLKMKKIHYILYNIQHSVNTIIL